MNKKFQRYGDPADCHGKRINLRAKRKTSRQKEKLQGKRKTSGQKEKPYGKKNNLAATKKE